ncbi:sugar kinase [Microbacterium barkeri]|uniref:Sugar kinase n=1 Tax=Microbacterium barkeri TaxID=33917 RepID=A0A9W6H4S0_9MICO|nr:ROK family transcriptional regulator [Microbacterium barkeri]MDI6944596.1 ROK family transcriptional regulator [Microbacterium barkeri]MDR6877191.1 putative NBD/HSP70 family sugar kinase [Microbacterium barkeri]GLJ62612.1 sugar kinase [Microbacterium barkeri]
MPSRAPSPLPPRGPRRRGSNLPRVADYNQMLVLDLVRRSPGISRVELVRETGLTAQTVSNICRRLTEAELIRETGRVSGAAGAPRTIFEVNGAGRYTIGLHIDPARLTFVILTLAGDTVQRLSMRTPDTPEPGAMLAEIELRIRELIDAADIPFVRVAAIGVATPGPIDVAQGSVRDAPNLPGWEDVALREDLEERLGLPVVVEKDTTAAALGELWSNPHPPQNFAFMYLGTGAGAGIVLDGEVRRGSSSNLGNIGHMSGDPNGPICPCGGRGCLSLTALPATLVGEAAARELVSPVDLGDARAVERALAELCAAAAQRPGGDEAALIDRAARSYARVAGQLANALDLDAVIFGGPQWPAMMPSILRIAPPAIAKDFLFHALHDVEVRGSSINDDVGAVGAASLAMWATTFDAPTQLFLPGRTG